MFAAHFSPLDLTTAHQAGVTVRANSSITIKTITG